MNFLHLSCGLGLRYGTPIGPVRLDVGYRIPGAQFPKSANMFQQGDPGTIYGAPIAFDANVLDLFAQGIELRRASEQAGFSDGDFVEQLPEFHLPVRVRGKKIPILARRSD